jgi:hypothetical protein
MGRPTIFYILENETLNSFWVGRITTNEDCPFRSITQDELNERLYNKYTDMNPYLTLVTLNKNWNACYGVERWLSKLDYKINKEPEKYKEVKNLLMAGWDDYMETSTLSVMHILRENQPINDFYKRLVSERESKGMRCLNTTPGKSYSERYEKCKKDPNFMYKRARKEVLRQMEKTGKLPKPETLMKYQVKDEELKECMEEVSCEPCEKKFYKKGKHSYCPCDIRVDRCKNLECKVLGTQMGVRVGGSICEHNTYRSTCKKCDGGEVCEHDKIRSRCKKCGGGYICEHNNYRSQCKKCGGVSICEHNINRIACRKCIGSQVCKHNITRSVCKECGGGAICKHNRERGSCKTCNPHGYIAKLRRARRRSVINSPNPTHTLDDLCMTTEEWLKYLHKTFEDRYGRPKTEEDEVHIDEIIPCSAWNLPDDNKYCWHYLNSQWLLAEDNLSKSDSYEEGDKLAMIDRIQSS